MRSLILDVGNSKIASAIWSSGDGLEVLNTRPTPDEDAGDDALVELAQQLLKLGESRQAGRLVLASVVPKLDAALLDLWPDSMKIDATCPLPFGLGIKEAKTVGADRLCNMAAAVAVGLNNALVVDAGTATTIDLLLDGEFRGGLIAPGMAFAAASLAARAARLKEVDFGPVPLEVGVDTPSAMAAGAWHVGRNGVTGTVRQLLDHYGKRPVILTGGLAPLLQEESWALEPEWTLRGAAILGQV